MNGKRIAELLTKFGTVEAMTDAELAELSLGLEFLYRFNREMNFTPESVYYGSQLESVNRMRTNREQKS